MERARASNRRRWSTAIYQAALLRSPERRRNDRWRLSCWAASRPAEGIEDLLWAVVMLPEFQLIY